MKVLSIIASVIVILMPVLVFIASTRQGWKVSPSKRQFWLQVFCLNLLGLAVAEGIVYLAGVFRNFC